MLLSIMQFQERFIGKCVVATAGLAFAAMFFHSPNLTRQPDVQQIAYALELLQSVADGSFFNYLFEARKYPLFYVGIHSVLFGFAFLFMRMSGSLSSLNADALLNRVFLEPWPLHLLSRGLTVLAAFGVLYLLYHIARRLYPQDSPWLPVISMCTSVIFLVFATAMRAHMLAIFFILLTFLLSIGYAEQKSRRGMILSFAAATAAFCTLQNGLFAFIFPVWAHAVHHGRFGWKRLFSWRLATVLAVSLFAASILGYPNVWRELLIEGRLGTGLGNEDIATSPFGTVGYLVFLKTMVGSELLLLIPAGISLWLAVIKRIRLHQMFVPAGLFCLAIIFFFGALEWATPRYFFAIVPFVALLGVPALARYRWFAASLALIAVAMHIQFTVLALRSDTYDLAREYVLTDTEGAIASNVPHYYLNIPPTRASIDKPTMAFESWLQEQPMDLAEARPYAPFNRPDLANVLILTRPIEPADMEPWERCFSAKAAPVDDSMFLWVEEVDWALFRLWQTAHLGPNIDVYCRRP